MSTNQSPSPDPQRQDEELVQKAASEVTEAGINGENIEQQSTSVNTDTVEVPEDASGRTYFELATFAGSRWVFSIAHSDLLAQKPKPN